MVDVPSLAIKVAELGYKRYGIKGAVVGAVAAGGSVFVVRKVVTRVADADEAYIDDLAERARGDEQLNDLVEEQFSKGVGTSVEKIEGVLESHLGDQDRTE
jgi:hypothetical protein